MSKFKSHQNWSWILLITFLVLSILDSRFGILAILCMTAPLYHAFRGRGKFHCSHHCPRGSFLGIFLKHVSFQNKAPRWMKKTLTKNILLGIMISMLSISIFHAHGDFNKISFSLFRFMSVSLFVGILVGLFFKPRTWCQVCPMGHATSLIKKHKDSKKNKNILKNEKIA